MSTGDEAVAASVAVVIVGCIFWIVMILHVMWPLMYTKVWVDDLRRAMAHQGHIAAMPAHAAAPRSNSAPLSERDELSAMVETQCCTSQWLYVNTVVITMSTSMLFFAFTMLASAFDVVRPHDDDFASTMAGVEIAIALLASTVIAIADLRPWLLVGSSCVLVSCSGVALSRWRTASDPGGHLVGTLPLAAVFVGFLVVAVAVAYMSRRSGSALTLASGFSFAISTSMAIGAWPDWVRGRGTHIVATLGLGAMLTVLFVLRMRCGPAGGDWVAEEYDENDEEPSVAPGVPAVAPVSDSTRV